MMARYFVKTPIRHDGKAYAVFDVIELDDAPAQALLTVGAIESVPVPPGETGETGEAPAPAKPEKKAKK
jgi:hypothetical protein